MIAILIVVGSAVFHSTDNVYLSWDCPETGAECWAQGSIFWDNRKSQYTHTVYDDAGNELYTVVAE